MSVPEQTASRPLTGRGSSPDPRGPAGPRLRTSKHRWAGLARLVVAALAGVGTGLSFAPYHWVYLLPVAIAALTLVSRGRRLRSGFGLGVVFGVAFMLVLLPWVQVIGVYAWVPLAVVEGLFYGLPGLAAAALLGGREPGAGGRVRRATPGWPVWLAASWVLLEALRAVVPFGGFPWGRLAFAVEDTPVAPLLAYVGSPGVTFVVALVGTTLAWALLTLRRTPIRAVAGVAVVCALACLASAMPWAAARATDPRIEVAAVQGNVPGKGLEAFAEQRAVLDNHVRATAAFAMRVRTGLAPRPAFVVWPENSSDIDPYTDPAAHAAIGDSAIEVGAPLLMGTVVGRDGGKGWRNRAIVWSAKGVPGAYYDKTHPVPFGEYIPLRSLIEPLVPLLKEIPTDMIPGTRPGVLRVGPATAGVVMCFEVAYDSLLRNLVRGGANVIVVPTNNATYIGTGQVKQQFAMSRLRAIETGRYVVVASTDGISGIIAPDGRVLQTAPERRQAVLEQRIALISRDTPAMVLGQWPELLLSAAAVLAVLVALVGSWAGRRPRGRSAAQG